MAHSLAISSMGVYSDFCKFQHDRHITLNSEQNVKRSNIFTVYPHILQASEREKPARYLPNLLLNYLSRSSFPEQWTKWKKIEYLYRLSTHIAGLWVGETWIIIPNLLLNSFSRSSYPEERTKWKKIEYLYRLSTYSAGLWAWETCTIST